MNPIRPISALALAALLASLLCTPSPLTRAATGLRPRWQQTRADAEKDPVLAAMLTELDRSMSQLQLQGFAKPFFIQYRIEEVDDFETKAEFGSSEGSKMRISAWRASRCVSATIKPTAPADAATVPSNLSRSTTIPSRFALLYGRQPTKPTRTLSPPMRKSRRH